MSEKEILEKQQQAGEHEFYLVRIGLFLRAYSNGAFALARTTGYRVLRKHRKQGDIVTCGFPSSQFEQVRQRLIAAGAQVEEAGEDLWLIRGLDDTPDESMVCQEPPRTKGTTMTIVSDSHLTGGQSPCAMSRTLGQSPFDWLAEAIKSFNLSLSTPMDAMQFISSLQQELACASRAL